MSNITPLHFTARFGHDNVVRIEHKAEVVARCDGGFTALYFAARFGQVKAIQKMAAAIDK